MSAADFDELVARVRGAATDCLNARAAYRRYLTAPLSEIGPYVHGTATDLHGEWRSAVQTLRELMTPETVLALCDAVGEPIAVARDFMEDDRRADDNEGPYGSAGR